MRTLDEWLEYITRQHEQEIDMGLDRMRELVERLALTRPAPKVMTVAGTNGKGSTCVASEALLQARGVRTGVTLSPHIVRFNERIRIDGKDVGDALVIAAFEAIDGARKANPDETIGLTYFEFSALAALWCFKHSAVDVAILEIGLGGRLDAFNVIDADIAVITSIGLDHEAFLGSDVDQIGAEKAGILRSGQYVALGVDMPKSVELRCRELNVKPHRLESAFKFEVSDGQRWWVQEIHSGRPEAAVTVVPMGQIAPHNLLLALLASRGLYDLSIADLARTAPEVSLPGRMQQVTWQDRHWLLDVAHNPAGARFLKAQLDGRQVQPAAIVCGMLVDKHHPEVFEDLHTAFPGAPWFCMDTHGPRGMSAGALVSAMLNACDGAGAKVPAPVACGSWSELVEQLNSATSPGSVILLLGSFNLIEQFQLIDKSLEIQN